MLIFDSKPKAEKEAKDKGGKEPPASPSDEKEIDIHNHPGLSSKIVNMLKCPAGDYVLFQDFSQETVLLDDDFKVTMKIANAKFCHFWLNTRFLEVDAKGIARITLYKEDVDKALKDKKCNTFRENFQIQLIFARSQAELS